MDEILIIDTETTADETQRLLFGCYRYCVRWQGKLSTLAEGLFYADDLPERDPVGFQALSDYAVGRVAGVNMNFSGPREPNWNLEMMTRSEFVERWLWKVGYMRQATIVGFNLPFDLSRLALDVSPARAPFEGGFSFTLWSYPMRPRLRIKHVDSKRSFIGWGIPDIPHTPKHRGKFVDLRTATFALTNSGHSLRSACETFGVEHGKGSTDEWGVITPDFVAYCRQDVQATTELYDAVCQDYARHPVGIELNKVFSPASLAKGYYRKMGITPPLDKFRVSDEILGRTMSTFYGARSECKIRKVAVPVTVVDFTSMYPTVNALMNLWDVLTAADLAIVDATPDLQSMLELVTLDDCFRPDTWRQFVGIAKVRPDGDILPVRAQYGSDSSYNIGLNKVTSDADMWYAIPDLVASKLLTGKAPKVLEAIRFVPVGKEASLRPINLRSELTIDPRSSDFFTHVIEQRARVRNKNKPLGDFLKVLANSGSYGIFAEMNRTDDTSDDVTVYSAAEKPWTVRVRHPEQPGRYCFPPVATCITAGARLMLAMLESCVTDKGGSWAFADTDSMAIVTGQGPHGMPNLPSACVTNIIARFDRLSPYDPGVVPHLLKTEYVGSCYAISAKRYVLYGPDEIYKHSEHGLGHLRGPNGWMRELWQSIITDDETPAWLDSPALSQWTVSTPGIHKTLNAWNDGKNYADQIKPFNFLSVCFVSREHWPQLRQGVKRFQLIRPYVSADDPTWEDKWWINKYDPAAGIYYVTNTFTPMDKLVTVKTYRDVLAEYRVHPETKFDGPDGNPCGRDTVGLLQRKNLVLSGLDYIGKESNRVEESQLGLFSPDDVRMNVTSEDQKWDQLRRSVFEVLNTRTDVDNAGRLDVSVRQFRRLKAGDCRPHRALRDKIVSMAVNAACKDLLRSPAYVKDPGQLLTEWRVRRNERVASR